MHLNSLIDTRVVDVYKIIDWKRAGKKVCPAPGLSLNIFMVLKIYYVTNIHTASLWGQAFPHFMVEETKSSEMMKAT